MRLRDRIRRYEKAGWRVVQGKHLKAYCPCGQHMIVSGTTPSGGNRAAANEAALFRRLLRECPGAQD